jgi:Ca2+-dependent lipid-binding protein
MAGLVGLRISIHDVSRNGPYDWSKGVWGSRLSKRPGNLKARLYIYQCRDLPAADSNGTSDPFLIVHDSDKLKRTITIEDNLNPIFYQALDLVYEANDIKEMPPFVIDCMDEDPGFAGSKPTADFLNRAVIPVKDI